MEAAVDSFNTTAAPVIPIVRRRCSHSAFRMVLPDLATVRRVHLLASRRCARLAAESSLDRVACASMLKYTDGPHLFSPDIRSNMTPSPVSPSSPIGLIVPPASGEVPGDASTLYPHIPFIARGLGLPSVSPAGYDQVIDAVTRVACDLVAAGAGTVSLMGTSLSFYRGAAFNRELQHSMEAATGKPCTTMSNAVLRAIEALGLKRVVLATAYIDDVNQRLTSFLASCGVQVEAALGLELTDVAAIENVDTPTLIDLCERAWKASPQADGIVLSCGGLRTLDALPVVEQSTGVPVVSSSPAGLWDVVRAAGLDARIQGHGHMLQCA